MKRAILDTNIYGMIVKEPQISKIRNKAKKNYIIYGIDLIRKELRDTPKKIKIADKGLRVFMLSIYDDLVGKHNLRLNDKMKKIAGKYYETYREIGGIRKHKELFNDFCIVSCASVKDMDLVVSNDRSTLTGELAVKSYRIVNKVLDLRTPKFIDYMRFKKCDT